MKLSLALLLVLSPVGSLGGENFTYWIEPCTSAKPGCVASDEELARWAIEAWQKASDGGVVVTQTAQPDARLRVFWAAGREGLYGETRGFEIGGKIGAEVYVRPTLAGLGPDIAAAGDKDALFRDTIVYLTCLHELGHAFRLPHTRSFPDIMYNFAYGGDFLEYFGRYRRALRSRASIPQNSGLSTEDIRRLRLLYPSGSTSR